MGAFLGIESLSLQLKKDFSRDSFESLPRVLRGAGL